jgi:phospholipid/cholesterol/gamma-HCH transport system substrate-binding protein
MRRIAFIAALLCAVCGSVLVTVAGADDTHNYQIEFDNAFGIVKGSDVRVAGVTVGSVTDLNINEDKRAVVSIETSGALGALGEKSTCSSEPQSLIAEYYIDCQPDGPPLADNGTIPVEQTTQTVQQDLVQNTMRESFRNRLTLLINEFGTGLAGNGKNLNAAIRRGAPALLELEKTLRILSQQNTIIRDLNANSDKIITQLANRREDVVRFVQTARNTAAASAAVSDSLSRDFQLLPDFLRQLRPTLADLEGLANQQTPLLVDLHAVTPQLNQLQANLIPFNSATATSLNHLGNAAVVGTRALTQGQGTVRQLKQSSVNAFGATEPLVAFLRDLDDPSRAVQDDAWAARDTGRPAPTGYTGMEGLLNYVYYQAGALNQFDRISHFLHFSLYEVNTGPCGNFSTGRDQTSGEPGVPAAAGGTTTSFLDANHCTGWLGPNQPGINQRVNLPPYDPSVCPHGTAPAAALQYCNPAGTASASQASSSNRGGGGSAGGTPTPPATGQQPPSTQTQPEPTQPNVPPPSNTTLPGNTQDLLNTLQDLLGLGNGSSSQGGLGGLLGGGGTNGTGSSDQAAGQDLLNFLFGSN